MSKKIPLEKEIAKKSRFKLAGINSRATFMMVEEAIKSTSKSLLTIASVIFAGSLTFLGLTDKVGDSGLLKWSWLILGASVLAYLFVRMAIIDSLLLHGRTETDAKQAEDRLVQEGLTMNFFKAVFSSHGNQANFFKVVSWLLAFLILQALAVIAGGILMGMFVWQSL